MLWAMRLKHRTTQHHSWKRLPAGRRGESECRARPSSPGIWAPAPGSLPSPLLTALLTVPVGQWGRGTGLREAEGGVARQWTSRRCECGSWTPAPARGPVKCVCFLLACACNAEELSLNVKVPLDCLSFSLIPAMSL